MEQDFKPVAQPLRRLNPSKKEVVRKEVQKLLEARMIYPIQTTLGLVMYKWCLRNEV